MKQYVIDELRPADHQKIKDYLDEYFGPPEMGSIYWIPVNASLYTDQQAEHTDCHPLYFAIHLEPSSIVAELLVRTKNQVRCDCMQYANEDQLSWFIGFVDSIFSRFGLKT